jgi:hypothetical protein
MGPGAAHATQPLDSLPPLPQLTHHEKHILLRRRQLNSAYRGSPYFIEVIEEGALLETVA